MFAQGQDKAVIQAARAKRVLADLQRGKELRKQGVRHMLK